jgi:thiol-disulfide isomerase/thioredoxin
LEQVRNNSPLIPRMLPKNEEPAFDVVDSYEAGTLFLQQTKLPFLVLYYANWCPHSARAIPVVQEFAKTVLQSRQIPLVAIEADNPLSDNIDGFPTVHLYLENNNAGGGSDGNRAAPTEFTSKMSVTNLVAFLNRNVPISNDGPNYQKEKIEKIQRNGQVALSALRMPR